MHLFNRLLFILFGTVSFAQFSPDCRTAVPICADAPINGVANGRGAINDFTDEVTESGCLLKGSSSDEGIEHNSLWYVFRAGADGEIGFDIEALPSSGGAITAEWDFAVYGPDVACGDISTGTAQPLRCNYESDDSAFTGIGVNPVTNETGGPNTTFSENTYDEWLNVREGEIYYILINNYETNLEGDEEQFIFTFTGDDVTGNAETIDCTFRDEFLGLDFTGCDGDEITISALNSPAGTFITDVEWSVDYNDDGNIDTLTGTGDFGAELVVTRSGRYFVNVIPEMGEPYPDEILITFNSAPIVNNITTTIDHLLNSDSDNYTVKINVDGNGNYEYALNGGDYQDSPVFYNVPPGVNSVVVNDKNGCGTSAATEFLVVGYPKFFTPNADSINDTWNIKGLSELSNPKVFVFDRFGKLLAELSEGASWDGTFNGKQMPSSDYWFKLSYERSSDELLVAKIVKAHFALKR